MGRSSFRYDGNENAAPNIRVGDQTAGNAAYSGGGNQVSYDGGQEATFVDRRGQTVDEGGSSQWWGGGGASSAWGGYDSSNPIYSSTRESFLGDYVTNPNKSVIGKKPDDEKEKYATSDSVMQAVGMNQDKIDAILQQSIDGAEPMAEESAPKPKVKKSTAPQAVSADEVADSYDELEQQPNDSANTLGYVDTDTGEVFETAEERSGKKAKVRDYRGRGRNMRNPAPSSNIAKAMRAEDRRAADGTRTTYLSPGEFDANLEASVREGLDARQVANYRRNVIPMKERMADVAALQESLDNWVPDTARDIWEAKRMEAEGRQADHLRRDAEYVAAEDDAKRIDDFIPGDMYGDEEWTLSQPLSEGATNQEKQVDELIDRQLQRSRAEYESMSETEGRGTGNFDDQREGRFAPWRESEDSVLKTFAEARDAIRLRLINPILLNIESRHVEVRYERENGKPVRKARVRYSNDVEARIGVVREMYKCSIRDVLELVQLRAGLGVDINGKIAKKDPGEFKLTDKQFMELCDDIMRSQIQYGHPMGIVQGTPGGSGLRDDSGKFVVVAGTRCYPLGYVPAKLLRNLSRQGSILEGRSIEEIQRDIGDTWLNDTYRQIVANSEGNLMWQARALENMMRAVMSMDGVDPGSLDIPEVKINQTMMQMAVEKESAKDPQISRAIEERERRERYEVGHFRSRYVKDNGGRDKDGNLLSPARRRNTVGDLARGVSSLTKAARAADVFLWVTSPIEALGAMKTQSIAEWMSDLTFNAMHGDIAKDYEVTKNLSHIASQKETVEARSVAESLYKIGGWAAIDAFIGTEGKDGRHEYRFNNADLRRFLADNGVTGESIPTALMQKLGIEPKRQDAFMANMRGVMDMLDDVMLGSSNLFKEHESQQFVKLSMMEMARAYGKRESYTSDEVEQWAARGGDEMVRDLLRTDAGREAFMTQGVTSLGRKSPMEHALRRVMARNGVTELAVRAMFDRFPEYGMNKIMSQIPLSNTLSYIGSYLAEGTGDALSVVMSVDDGGTNFLQRTGQYQMGRRLTFAEGLRKNLLYDTVMAGNKLVMGCVYYGVLKLLGGLFPPDEPEDLYTWSEWIIGDGENALPIRWAWFMDDFSGVGLPLGAAFAIADHISGSSNPLEWTPEARDVASRTFLNAIANFNDGTALFDAFELVNNFEEEMNDAIGNGEKGAWLEPSDTLKRQTSVELMAWKLLGDLTPTVVKQLLPWSRDFLFREDYRKRSASKTYDTTGRTMKEAQEQYEVKPVEDYREYMLRSEAQNNPIAALLMDVFYGAGGDSDKTGYKFTEQPLRTEVDPLAKAMWDRWSLGELPRDPDEAKEVSRSYAEAVCQMIDSEFKDPTDALTKGFILNPDGRLACQEYCFWMMYDKIPEMEDIALDEARELFGSRYIPDEEYDNIKQTYDDMKAHYKSLYDNYFSGSSDIPWKLPRYTMLDSDTETRYIGEDGGPAVNPLMAGVANMLGMNVPVGTPERYSYGNIPNSLPFYSPEERGNSEPYWVRRDKDGSLLTDVGAVYDMVGGMRQDIAGPNTPLADQLFGDRGENSVPTLQGRGYEPLEQTIPEGFSEYYDPEQVSKILGFEAFDKDKKSSDDDDASGSKKSSSSYGGSYGSSGNRRSGSGYYTSGGRSGGGVRYYGGGGGGYASSYNPKIYSNAKQVYSSRASGMQVRQPYGASNRSYLRPNFYTKGSREAYRRSDI